MSSKIMRMYNRKGGLILAVAMTVITAMAVSIPSTGFAWEEAYPGVRYLAETRPGPNRIRAVEVDLCTPGVSVRATRESEAGQTTSAFGSQINAEVAVNADFYSWPANPSGLAMGAGEKWSDDTQSWGYIGFGAQNAVIGPPLQHTPNPPDWMSDAVGGNIMVLTDGAATNDSGTFCTTRHPRTIAGLSADSTKLILATVDGRSTSSIGMTCTELGYLMSDLGAHNALNLDGGGSTTMWRKGAGVVNVPSGDSERVVANHLAIHATGQGPAVSCAEYDVAIDTNFLGIDVINTDGDGGGYPDVFPGDRFQAEIVVSNQSPGVIRDVWAGYWLEHPFLEALDYQIYSDHPAYDQQSWELNDANEAPENPEGSEMGQEGALNLYAFSPGESKRILIELEAIQPSIGMADHPDLRAWVRNIENIYGVQDGFWDDPNSVNHVGENLRAFSELDILSQDHWHFSAPLEDHFEGWRRCDDSTESMQINTDRESLVADSTDQDCLQSPPWTHIDARIFDEMVIRTNSGDELSSLTVEWGGSVSGEARFEFSLDQPTGVLRLPLGEHAEWSEEVDRIRLRWTSGNTFEIESLFFQSASEERTTSPHEEMADGPGATLVDGEEAELDADGDREEFDAQGDNHGSPGEGDQHSSSTSSCSSAATLTPTSPLFLILMLMIGLFGRSAIRRARLVVGITRVVAI